jgi:cytochrome c biogenesis protein CcmG/thiol:disulfide interchange protein DsbE
MLKNGVRVVVMMFVISLSFQFAAAQKQKAADFTLKTVDGKAIKLSDYAGKIVLVNFWATWCPPCRQEIPDFVEVYHKNKDKGFVIIGIALDQDGWSAVTPFAKKINITYPLVLGTQEVVDAYGPIKYIPTTFIIDREGYIVNKRVGGIPKADLEEIVSNLL